MAESKNQNEEGSRIFPLCFSCPLIWHITDRRFLTESEGLLFKTLDSCSLDMFAAGIGAGVV